MSSDCRGHLARAGDQRRQAVVVRLLVGEHLLGRRRERGRQLAARKGLGLEVRSQELGAHEQPQVRQVTVRDRRRPGRCREGRHRRSGKQQRPTAGNAPPQQPSPAQPSGHDPSLLRRIAKQCPCFRRARAATLAIRVLRRRRSCLGIACSRSRRRPTRTGGHEQRRTRGRRGSCRRRRHAPRPEDPPCRRDRRTGAGAAGAAERPDGAARRRRRLCRRGHGVAGRRGRRRAGGGRRRSLAARPSGRTSRPRPPSSSPLGFPIVESWFSTSSDTCSGCSA